MCEWGEFKSFDVATSPTQTVPSLACLEFCLGRTLIPVCEHSLHVHLQMAVYAVPAVVTALMAAVAFWPKKPPVPPAPSADKVNISFLQGLVKVLTNISFWVLLVVWGCGAGIFNALVTLLAQMLCPFGYSDVSST